MVILGAVLSARAVAVDLELLRNGATRRVLLLLNHGLCGRDSAAEEHSSGGCLAAVEPVQRPPLFRFSCSFFIRVAVVTAGVAWRQGCVVGDLGLREEVSVMRLGYGIAF
ncbi:uncharacterized protein DS421_20g699230 [Arachis hypogaea]|nr:uncharacterized protein DS421_20g699230 [Arachis hypogaea]